MTSTPVPVTAGDLHDRIEQLAAFNADRAAGGITREVYSPEYADACRYVAGLMEAGGLRTRVDAVGNLFGLWEGTDPQAPRVLTGSHIDTTLNAGKFDGVVGVLGAIAAIERLRSEGVTPRRGIEVVAFAGEEPRFGQGCTGSLVAVGSLTREDLDDLHDRAGASLAAVLRQAGFEPEHLPDALIDPARYHGFVELHIEQGAVLEDAGLAIGVVTHIAAPHDLRLILRGAAMHAGATPMLLRRDALAGAAEVVLALERLARESPSGRTVGTIGVVQVRPGAINVIPGEVELEVDVRDVDETVRDAVVNAFLSEAQAIAGRRGLELTHTDIGRRTPAACDTGIVEAARSACAELGVEHLDIVSGAYHDAMVLSAVMAMGMIFVPSVGGVSHSPLEHTDTADLELGVAVLTRTLARLAT